MDMTLNSTYGTGWQTISDYRQFIDSIGVPLPMPKTVIFAEANAAILRGQHVMWVAPASATVGLRVAITTAGAAKAWQVIGVAENAATAAGQRVQVCVGGITFGYVTGLTITAMDRATASATAGLFGNIAVGTDPDATIIEGSVLGQFLGAKLTVAPNVDLAPLHLYGKF